MKAEIIAVGTELLLGQIANTNAQFISKKLAEVGIDVLYHSVVGDNAARLAGLVETAQQRSDIIIFTGGLGPTKDDLTKETIARCMGRTLALNSEAMEQILAFFARRGTPMTENNRKQALVIEGSTVFPNDHGMAPGMAVESSGIRYLLFPGPPKELNPMFENYALPYLLSLSSDSQVVHSKVLRFYGIGESLLEEKLIDLIDGQSNPTIAPLANEAEVTIRITAKADTIQKADEMISEVEREIESRVGEFIYGYNQDSLHSVLVAKLKENGLTLSLAESCTGGLISHLITNIPGSSEVYAGGYVSYTEKAKVQALGVDSALIDKHGTVSEEVASAMALMAKSKMSADIALSVTGVAGPGTVEGKPVGQVFIGVATANGEKVYPLKLSGTREGIQLRAAKYGMYYLLKELVN